MANFVTLLFFVTAVSYPLQATGWFFPNLQTQAPHSKLENTTQDAALKTVTPPTNLNEVDEEEFPDVTLEASIDEIETTSSFLNTLQNLKTATPTNNESGLDEGDEIITPSQSMETTSTIEDVTSSLEDPLQYSKAVTPTVSDSGLSEGYEVITTPKSTETTSLVEDMTVENSNLNLHPKNRTFPYKIHEKSKRRKEQIAEIIRRYEENENESSTEVSRWNKTQLDTELEKRNENRDTTTISTTITSVIVSTTTRKLEPAYIPQQPKILRRVNDDPQNSPIECLQPIDRWNAHKRPCAEGKSKWHYDSNTGVCRYFNYLGCGKSANRFGTRRECEAFCIEKIEDPCDVSVSTCYSNYSPTCFTESYLPCMTMVREENPDEDPAYLDDLYRKHCPPKVARCKSDLFKYVKLNLSPNFENTMMPELCTQTPDKGSCPGVLGRGALRYFFDPIYRSCRTFYFSGCSGNDNRFDSFQKCMDYCGI